MGYLAGLQDYLNETYHDSIFDQALESKQPWEFHIHGHQVIQARIKENLVFDLNVDISDQGERVLPKIQIKFVYPSNLTASIRPLIKTDEKIKQLALEPILSPRGRYFIKNKSLFPLMNEKQVVFLYSLEGDVLRGIITDFSRYEITVALKGGNPATILRHSIYDLRDKKGRCFLKSFQEHTRDWEKSGCYVRE
jgi:hypothetical protein